MESLDGAEVHVDRVASGVPVSYLATFPAIEVRAVLSFRMWGERVSAEPAFSFPTEVFVFPYWWKYVLTLRFFSWLGTYAYRQPTDRGGVCAICVDVRLR